MPLVKNSEYEAEITGYSSDGAGVARIDGQVVFIPGTVEGEVCKIKILKVNKNIAYGKLVSVTEPSKNRITPECKYYPRCGGCDFHHITYEEELRAKENHVQSVITRIGGLDIKVEPIVGSENTSRYRNKAQFPIGMADKIVSGFYRSHSHNIVPCDDCIIQSEFANKLCKTVISWMEKFNIPPYDERENSGIVRHVYVRNEMLCLVVTKKPKFLDELTSLVLKEHPEVSGIILNYNKENTNVILGEKDEVIFGDGYVLGTLCGNEFMLSPHAFYQVNHAQAERLYALAIEKACLSGSETVIDLYCGAGTITLALAKHAKNAIGVEIVPQAIQNAKENARRNGAENVEFICGDATLLAGELKLRGICADVVVVDPPRKGLTPELIKTIAEINPKRVVYVSCDPATLARDLRLFGEVNYKTDSVTPVDMFPRTRHCEVVCALQRQALQ